MQDDGNQVTAYLDKNIKLKFTFLELYMTDLHQEQ
jgi:hypothetical protein